MKKIGALLFALVGLSTLAIAQVKGGQNTVIIKTPTVQCEECKARIEKYLGHEEGIIKVEVDVKKKTTKVTFVTDRTNIENVKALIADAGYDADDITAEPDSYKRLPLCCKKPEDGGGHPKTN